MNIKDTLFMCLGNLKRRKGRTFLSVLGVVVGCCSIVSMMSIGVGMSASQEAWIAEMGDLTAIEVYPNYMDDSKLDDALVTQLNGMEHIKTVAAQLSFDAISVQITAGRNNRYCCDWASVAGYDSQVIKSLDYQLTEGELPAKKGTVAIGEYMEYGLRDTKRPDGRNYIDYYDWNTGEPLEGDALPKPYVALVGNTITLSVCNEEGKIVYSQNYKVVGKLKKDYNIGSETESGVLMLDDDIKAFSTAAQKALNQKPAECTYSGIKVFADSMDAVTDVEKSIQGLGYDTSSMESMRESTQKEMATIQLALGGIGAVSLFVAAIGIMNTMIMSVSERTKEIGIMKALGCFVTDIRRLFLLEAASIGFLGGVIGSLLSYGISVIINIVYAATGNAGEITDGMVSFLLTSPNRISVIPVWLFLFGLLFSMLIGLASGAYPAIKAVKISPLEAMKNE